MYFVLANIINKSSITLKQHYFFNNLVKYGIGTNSFFKRTEFGVSSFFEYLNGSGTSLNMSRN